MSPGGILFFTRGRGRGHAVPDIELAREMSRCRPDLTLQFASYATGAATLGDAGCSVLDMGLKEDPSYVESLMAAGRIIAAARPRIVISHEEFAALPLAKALGLATVLMIDFFPPVQSVWGESILCADQVLFIEQRGIFPEPPPLQDKVRYIGPIVRRMTCSRKDRNKARAELDLSPTATVVSVIPGAWATEERAPSFDLVVAAFRLLPWPEKSLLWVAGRDREFLLGRSPATPAVSIITQMSPIEKLMVGSDLVITKANRGTTIDLASLGIPSISLSFGMNPIDEMITPRIRSNVALNVRGIDADFLGQAIVQAVAADRADPVKPCEQYAPGGAARAAAELAAIIDSIGQETARAWAAAPV